MFGIYYFLWLSVVNHIDPVSAVMTDEKWTTTRYIYQVDLSGLRVRYRLVVCQKECTFFHYLKIAYIYIYIWLFCLPS
jgi:hypothetical protein